MLEKSEKVEVPDPVRKAINNPRAVKAVSTIGEDGIPHTVFKQSMRILEDGNIAFLEMIENSRTTKNILNQINVDEENKLPLISISILDPDKNVSWEIKGKFDQFIIQGPLWRDFLKECWGMFPDIDPAGVWVFVPVQVNDQSLYARLKEEGDRLEPQGHFWFKYQYRKLDL